ncbi:RodZ family helix-turn-helix domain-containing protein [Williamsia sterculiae]|uniref:Cell division protein FtsL n=1 Tax=Williamsia sterculiae TaxID=1344003 RepID=A0A1N7H6V5_9NOCA|nr:hypothetical protein [Williamsia sterculiae]SIS20604.1 hypothetical protein SAMN05445060_3635 [Williamsia sterculiae]
MTVVDERGSDTGSRRRPATSTRNRGRTGAADGSARANRSPAAQRALDRRRKRLAGRTAAPEAIVAQAPSRRALTLRSPMDLLRRTPFVVVIIAMLFLGLALTLFLSTRSAQDSYRLGVEKDRNDSLLHQRDAEKKLFEAGDSAPELAKRAAQLGMVLSTDAPRVLTGANGKVRVLGDPEPVQGQPQRALNTPVSAAPSSGSAPTSARSGSTSNSGATQQTPVSAPTAPGTQIATNVLPQASSPNAGQTPSAGSAVTNTPPTGGAPTANQQNSR